MAIKVSQSPNKTTEKVKTYGRALVHNQSIAGFDTE